MNYMKKKNESQYYRMISKRNSLLLNEIFYIFSNQRYVQHEYNDINRRFKQY